MDGISRDDEEADTEDVEIASDLSPPETRPYELPELSATTSATTDTKGVVEPTTRPFDPERHHASLQTLAMRGGLAILAAIALLAYLGVIFIDDIEKSDQVQALTGLLLPPVVGILGFAAGRERGGS